MRRATRAGRMIFARKDTPAALMRGILSRDPDRAHEAMVALQSARGRECLPRLLKVCLTESKGVIANSAAMSVVAYWGEREDTARFLIRGLRSKRAATRAKAAWALKNAPQRAALEPLVECALRDPDESARLWALYALGCLWARFGKGRRRIRERLVPVFKAAFEDRDPRIRKAASIELAAMTARESR